MRARKVKRATPAAPKRSKERQIVLLDQRPLRRTAASECSRAMARLEKTKAEWKRFQQDDQAAFGRWVASTFGALLTQIREIEEAVRAKEALVQEVEMEVMFGGARNLRAAYGKVLHRRDHPEPAADPQSAPPPPPFQDEEAGEGGPFDDIPEFAQEWLFEDFLRVVMGMNPDRMNEREYKQMFADFKANVLGQECPEPQPASPPPSPASEQSRLKELYRQLVRRLHPDTKADGDTEASAIWHEVQDAYSTGNVERLEMLLAMTDLQANATGEHTSLSQLRSVLAELRRSFNALQRNLRAAKKDPAWNFCALTDHSALEKRVRRELESKFLWHKRLLETLDAKIARWSAPPKARRKPVTTEQADFFS
jgi:hypothetical protein